MELSTLPYFVFVTIVTILVSVCPGNTEHVCDFDKHCLHIYNNMKGTYEEEGTSDLTLLCSLAQELKDCMKKVSRRCRGDLNYHFFEKLVRDLNSNIGVGKSCVGGVPKGISSAEGNHSRNRSGEDAQSSSNHHHTNYERRRRPGGRSSSSASSSQESSGDRCARKVPASAPIVGCALFGLTNLKSFSETLNYTDINYCSLAGAWNLIDTPEFAVQITNKGGLSPLPKDITATTLVTVIVKNNQCSERKTYQATFDEVPGMFSDGYTTAGNVYIQTIVESEHVKIHFPYLHTTIDVIKVLDKIPIPSLTVAIKMPESSAQSFMTDPKQLRGLPLCFYGCPRTATIKPRSSESSGGHTARSASSLVSSPTNYYKSNCPRPSTSLSTESPSSSADELPQADSPAPPALDKEEAEFSGSLSAEFLSQGTGEFSMSGTDFGGQRSQRSSSSSTAVICASLNSVHEVLSECTVVNRRLKFPGEEGSLANSHHHRHSFADNFANVMSSALVSHSSPVSQFHFVFVYLTVIFVWTWS